MTEHVFAISGLPGSNRELAAEQISRDIRNSGLTATIAGLNGFVLNMFQNRNDRSYDDDELDEWVADRKAAFGDGYFVRELGLSLDAADEDYFVIENVQSREEVTALWDIFDKERVTTITLWTMPDIRFERLHNEPPSEDHPEWMAFTERDKELLHEYGMIELFTDTDLVDHIVPHNDANTDLQNKLKMVVDEAIMDLPMPPNWNETPFPSDENEIVEQYI